MQSNDKIMYIFITTNTLLNIFIAVLLFKSLNHKKNAMSVLSDQLRC